MEEILAYFGVRSWGGVGCSCTEEGVKAKRARGGGGGEPYLSDLRTSETGPS